MVDKKFYVAPRPLEGEVEPRQAAIQAIIVAGWDPSDGYYHALNLGCLVEPLVLAERLHATDKLDDRDDLDIDVPIGTLVGEAVSGTKTVPDGEVWFVNRLQVICPAADADGSCSFNILCSAWPQTVAGVDKGYWSAMQNAMGVTTTVDLPAQGELGEELRLVGGDRLSLALIGTVLHTAAKTYTLRIWGRKGKAIIPQ